MPSPDMIRIEEFINYHRHELPMPLGDQRVRLNLQSLDLPSGKSVLQFGLTTPRAIDPELVAPLNLVMVIDQSSSMSGERIANVKSALQSFVQKLRKHDKVTIVGFSSTAQVHLPATNKTKVKKIRQAIDNIYANGSTNLHSGLMLGYQQAVEHFDPERTNRVILLTDGRTNTGEVDLDVIARHSKTYNKKGIDLSTIGLGNDLNHELLRKLADAGRGLIHFVADETDIEKTFVAEIDSLLAPAARRVKLTIDFKQSADSVKVFGYAPKRKGSKFVFHLEDLNHGATQVILASLSIPQELTVSAVLRYDDAITGETVKEEISVRTGTEILQGFCVKRNYAIAVLAKSFKRAATLSSEGQCEKSRNRLIKGLQAARRLIEHNEDEHFNRMESIVESYLSKMQNLSDSQLD